MVYCFVVTIQYLYIGTVSTPITHIWVAATLTYCEFTLYEYTNIKKITWVVLIPLFGPDLPDHTDTN